VGAATAEAASAPFLDSEARRGQLKDHLVRRVLPECACQLMQNLVSHRLTACGAGDNKKNLRLEEMLAQLLASVGCGPFLPPTFQMHARSDFGIAINKSISRRRLSVLGP